MHLLYQKDGKVDKFLALYEEDRHKARIYCFENNPTINRIYLNEVNEKNFQIQIEKNVYAVSTTLKRYLKKEDAHVIICKNGLFYFKFGSSIRPLVLSHINQQNRLLKEWMIQRYSWIRFLDECKFNDIPLNTIIKNKLYGRDKLLRHLYGVQPSVALKLHEKFGYNRKHWQIYKKSLINIENTNFDIFQWNDFDDLLRLAWKLNKKVNAAWSLKRCYAQHNEWAQEYANIISEYDNRLLQINDVFLRFNSFIGGGILLQSKDLILEGIQQKHCVGSYADKVDKGRCAIFHFKGYTAEISYQSGKLFITQFRGKNNSDVPEEISTWLYGYVQDFNYTALKMQPILEPDYMEPLPF